MEKLSEIRKSRIHHYVSRWVPLAIVIGFFSGIVMALFMIFIELLLSLTSERLAPITIVLAGLIAALLVKFGASEVEGPGITWIIQKKNMRIPISPRVILTRFIGSGASLGLRMPGGKEGPAMQIGGSLAYIIGKHLLKLNEDDLSTAITIGGGACTSAIFQAPLGGTIFATEVPYKRDLESDIYMPAFLASIVAVTTYLFISGFVKIIEPFRLNFQSHQIGFSLDWVALAVLLGAVIGGFSYLYTHAFTFFAKQIDRMGKSWIQILLTATVVGILVWLGGLFTKAPVAETGFQLLHWLSSNEQFLELNFLFALFILKMLIILFCIGGGNPVGIFGPSLILGALAGTIFAVVMGQTDYVGDFFILGMASMMAGTSKTPISSMILILEITGLPHLVLYMAITNTVTYILSGSTTLYTNQLTYRREAIAQELEGKDYLAFIPITSIMTDKVLSLNAEMTVDDSRSYLAFHHKHSMPVIEQSTGQLVGFTSVEDLRGVQGEKTINEVMVKDVVTIQSDKTLKEALDQVLSFEVERFPITDSSGRMVGFVTLHDMLRALRKQEKMEKILS